jgi:hypothetical protein
MLANINPWVVGGERPLDFSLACRIFSGMFAPAVIPTASFRHFLKASQEKITVKRNFFPTKPGPPWDGG